MAGNVSHIVYDVARHESSITQWLHRPNGILKCNDFDLRFGNQKSIF